MRIDAGVVKNTVIALGARMPLPLLEIALLEVDAVAERRARASCRCTGAARPGGNEESRELLLLLPTRGSRKRASRCSSRAQTVAVWRRRGCGALAVVLVGGCGGAACAWMEAPWGRSSSWRRLVCWKRSLRGMKSLVAALLLLFPGSFDGSAALVGSRPRVAANVGSTTTI